MGIIRRTPPFLQFESVLFFFWLLVSIERGPQGLSRSERGAE